MLESYTNILECEKILVSNLENIRLIGDILLSLEDIAKLEDFISENSKIDINYFTSFLKNRAPTSLSCYLVWKGILCYREGDFWTSIEKITGLSDPNLKSKWGNIFLRVLKSNKIPIFKTKDAHMYVTNILIQGTIPNSCLFDYYDKILYPLVTKELISSNPNEINFLLKDWRDYEFKRLDREAQLRRLNDTKNEHVQKIRRVNSIIELWDELEGLQLLRSKIESIDEPNIDEITDLRHNTDLEIVKTNKCIEDLEANREKHSQDLSKFSEEDSFILRHSESIENGLRVSLELIDGEKEAGELQEKIEFIKKNIDEVIEELFVGIWDEQYIDIIRQIRYEKLEEKIEEYQSLKNKEDEDKKASKSFIKSLFIKLYVIIPFLKKKEKNTSQLIYDDIQALFNRLPLDNKLRYKPTLSSVPLLKEFPNLYDDYFAFKENIRKVQGKNQELEAKLSTIANSVGIDSNENVREIQTKLTNLNSKIKTSQGHEKLAQIASAEIEKINAKIENELSYQATLKVKLSDLILNELPKLHYNYSFAKEKIHRVKEENQVLEAKLSIIANSIGIDYDEDVREIHIKLNNFSDKIKTSQEHEKLAQIASVEIEKINAKIEDKLSYQAILNTKLCDLDRDISQLKENSKIKKLESELYLKTENLLKLYPDLDELEIRIERLKKEGWDKSLCLEKIKNLCEKKTEIEAQINNLESMSTYLPTLKFFTYVDKPIQRYFLFCGEHAEDFLFQSTKMLRQSIEKGSAFNLTEINLHERIINSFEKWWEQYYQKSSKNLDNNIHYGSNGHKSPFVYLDYSGEIRAKFPSQFLQPTDSPEELYLSLLADESEIYNTPVRLYRLSENLFESEELDFEIKLPAENYVFQLIHGRKVIKLWDIPTGIKPTSPFIAFDYESKKLIPNSEIPRAQVLIVLKSEYLINPVDCLFEEGDLYGEWSEYKYKGIDLSEAATFIIFSLSNKYQIQVMEKCPWDIVLSKENLLEGVYSGDSELYIDEPPTIKVFFSKKVEIDNWILSMYRKNEFDFSYLQQNYLSELKDVLRIDHDNNLVEIPLEVEACLGKEVAGEFIVRLKNNMNNYDKEFIFCFFPYIKIQFNESIYLPKDSGNEEISLMVQLPESSNFEVNHPAKVVAKRVSSLDVITDVSERDIRGILKYATSSEKFSLPIRIQIPRVTWSLKGLNDDKYNREINEILEIPDEILYDNDGESLLLKVSFPSSINGKCVLKHQDSGQSAKSEIKGQVAVFDILRFIDTVKATSNSIQTFSINVSDIGIQNILIDNVSLFSIRKWTIQNIVCEQKKEGNKRIFRVKWDQEVSVEKECIVFWRLEDEVILQQINVNGSKNRSYFEIDEILVKPGRYLLHFTREDSWSQPIFPGENAPNSKEIYIDMDITDTSLLELGNKEFEAGNYMEAIDLYRKVPKSSNIDNVWIKKITNGLIYNHKYSEATDVFYHLVKNDKRLDDVDCFYIPSVIDNNILSRQKDLRNEDLAAMLTLLQLIVNKKYNLSSERSKNVIQKFFKN